MLQGGFLCFMLVTSSLFAQDRGRTIDYIQSDLLDIRENMRHLKVERELLDDRIETQNTQLMQIKKDLARFQQAQGNLSSSKSDQLQTRLNTLEKGQEAVVDDFKQLKKHLNDTSLVINKMSDHIEQDQSLIKGQIRDLKKIVESLVELLQSSTKLTTSSYKVKAGDALDKIAKSHGLPVDVLKKLNELTHDRISIGQTLRLE